MCCRRSIPQTRYSKMKIQPAQFINENNLEFAEGNAIKYICRHKAKGKRKDIEKAIHYLEMILERDYDWRTKNNTTRKKSKRV